jgi:rSAM/selenodomain-associated transferase 2
MNTYRPEISIIIPVLNEAPELTGLFDCLVEQHGIAFEIILCDGGSSDSSLHLMHKRAASAPFSAKIIQTQPGRGFQMNAGTISAESDLFLFLHVDSRFSHPDALRRAVSVFKRKLSGSESLIAARFGLRFLRQSKLPSLAYAFYEAKARLNRGDCIRGDQGFMITRTAFNRLGRFDTTLPFLEDVRLAAAIALHGRWLLLQDEISTSARRFEQEGLYERQVINAIIANAVSIKWDEFFIALPALYRSASESQKIDLFSFLEGIRNLLADKPAVWRRTFWMNTGRYVSENAWQLFFWLDVKRAYKSGVEPGDVHPRHLEFYQNRLKPIFLTGLAAWLAQLTVKIWFRFMLIRGTSRTV